jgi:hypothetical protein
MPQRCTLWKAAFCREFCLRQIGGLLPVWCPRSRLLRLCRQRKASFGRAARSYKTAVEEFGDVKLAELEQMSAEVAEWQATRPPAYRYALVRSLRQVLEAAVRWSLIGTNPAKHAGAEPATAARRGCILRLPR